MSNFFVEFSLILVLILANGLFSMAEMAIVSSRKVRLQQRAENGDERSRAALDLAENPNNFLSTVQVGITLIGTLTGTLGGASLTDELVPVIAVIPIIGQYATGIAIAVIVLLVSYFSLVLGELVPKRLALSDPEVIAGNVAGPMKVVALIGRPVVWLLGVSTDLVLRILRVKNTEDPPVTPEEITVLMEQGEQIGVFEEMETDIVEAVFRLGDLRAGALMTPRPDMDWVDLENPFIATLQVVLDSQHTHFPAARGGLDNVIGILRSRDLLSQIRHLPEDAEPDITGMILPAQFIPESMPAFQVLEVLKGAGGNLALVIDEYGGVIGMITLFDVMEAMVGGISERGEPVVPEAVQREDGSWLVEGMMRVDAFKKLLDVDELPGEDRVGYQTVGGFAMAQVGSVPTTGETFSCCGWRFEVLDMDGMRVDKLLASMEQEE